MLLLTATAETQGQNPGDFCEAIEGELVVTFADCHVPAHSDDLMRCREGCLARFFGLSSHERSTTAMVRDVPVSRQDFLIALSGYGERRGSLSPVSLGCVLAIRMVSTAATFLPGTVVGFADGRLTTRVEPRGNWRDALTVVSCMAAAIAWRRHYHRVIRSIDPDAASG